MSFLGRFLIAFLAVTGGVVLATTFLGAEFGHANFWDDHGLLFLSCITVFPRLTLFFSSVATGGLFWWLAWLFTPRLLVAVLATQAYWHQNPFLVVASWLVAFGGESSEKYAVVRRTQSGGGKGFDRAKWV